MTASPTFRRQQRVASQGGVNHSFTHRFLTSTHTVSILLRQPETTIYYYLSSVRRTIMSIFFSVPRIFTPDYSSYAYREWQIDSEKSLMDSKSVCDINQKYPWYQVFIYIKSSTQEKGF